MKTTISKIFALTLALCMVFSLLTACSNGGDTPSGDNAMLGVTDTETPSNTPDAADTAPDNTPAASDPPPATSETPTDEKQYGMPTWADPSTYNAEKAAGVDEVIEYYGELYGVDIKKLITDIIAEYGQYIDVHITPEGVMAAIIAGHYTDKVDRRSSRSLSCLPESSIEKANEFLASNGSETFDPKEYKTENDVKKDLACLAIAASLEFEPNFEGAGDDVIDLLAAFSRAYFGTDVTDNTDYNFSFTTHYVLFDLEQWLESQGR